MEKQKKVSKAKQRIVDNYERQKADFEQRGYKEYSEVFSAAKANAMVFVTSLPSGTDPDSDLGLDGPGGRSGLPI